MPFTPFHLGPGALFKGVGGERFSFMVFGGSQVLIDLEPAYRMSVGDPILHGPSHTLAGALVIGIIATLIGKPISEVALRLINYPRPKMNWIAAANGAFCVTFSHLFFDAIVHADMMPWASISDSNGLLFSLSVSELHLLCIGLGIVGALLYFSGWRRKKIS